MNTIIHKSIPDRIILRNRTHALWAPIILLESYLAITVLLFFYGPLEWRIPNTAKLVIFLFVNYVGLWLGYRLGIKRGWRFFKKNQVDDIAASRIPRQLRWLILFSMIFTIVSDIVRLYAIRGDMSAFIASFVNPGEAYRKSQMLAQMDRNGELMYIASFSWPFRINTLLGLFNGLYFPLALIYWRQLNIIYKVTFFMSMLSAIVFTVGLGAQSGIGALIFASLPVVLYKIYVISKPLSNLQKSKIRALREKGWNPRLIKFIIFASICALVVTVAFFQLDRAEDSGRELNAANDLGGKYASPSQHSIIPILGGRSSYGITMACMYISHGYQGLALSMELPFEWSYGLGWSKALQVILNEYLRGPDLFSQSYLMRNSQVNDWPNAWWSTIFPWIASDTTFYGTILFMILIGYIIGRCWVSTIKGNPIGFTVLAQMFTLVFMFPANNALAQTLEALFTLIGVFIIYYISCKYFRHSRSVS